MEKVLVPKVVLAESLYIRQPSDDNPDQLVPVEINLQPLINDGVIEPTEFTGDAELARFVELARIIDDGEAACLAMASVRGLMLATDDRRAIRVAADLGVAIVTTPELLKLWIEHTTPDADEVADIIHCIERYGRFKPHHTSPHARWWDKHGQDG
jgi:predicted nucleic acid-binding protein